MPRRRGESLSPRPEDQRRLIAGRAYPRHGLSLHGGACAVGDRAYCPWMRRGPIPAKVVHQAQDVLADRRGVIYMSEGNSGIYILRHQTSAKTSRLGEPFR